MIAARNDRTIRDVGQREAIGNKHFEVVKEFVYLGSLMTPTSLSLEIQRRIQTANRCFFGLRKHLQSSHLWRQTKFTIHRTYSTAVRRRCWPKGRRNNCSYLRGRFSERYAARKSKMVSTGEGTTTNSIKSLTAWMPLMSRRQADCATLVIWSEDPKPNPMEGEIKEDWNPVGGCSEQR
jgi:hypothetical protein